MKQEKETIFCTIIARNYLAQARVLMESISTHHPAAQLNVLIIDEKESKKQEQFVTTTLQDIRLPDEQQLAFKYTVTEFATAVKPYYLKYLFTNYKAKHIIFLDPDCKVYSPLKEIFTIFKQSDIILTPHITKPFYDDKNPSELTILRSGPYNLGFIAIKKTTNVLQFLEWWQEKLYHHCYLKGNLFVDQKWLMMAHALFENIFILKHPGYNVAYWNLHERIITQKNNQFLVNNSPLRFFHFSGYQVEHPHNISVHQNRFAFWHLNKEIELLFKTYKQDLLKKQYYHEKKKIYRFDYYQNKQKITPFERKIFALQISSTQNPFHTKRKSFYRYMRRGHFLKDRCIHLGIQVLSKTKKNFLENIIPLVFGEQVVRKIHKLISKQKIIHQQNNMIHQQDPLFGVNILGYHTTESGMGESARSLTRILQATNIPFVLNNDASTNSRQEARMYQQHIRAQNKYNNNIIIINGDRFADTIKQMGKTYFAQRQTIAYWTWELEQIPLHWPSNHPLIKEFWVPSTFVQKALQKRTTKPVHIIPHSIKLPETNIKQNKNKNIFTFLFMFDFYSYIERKNPFGLINAFTQAFTKNEPVQLVIKCVNETFDKKAFLTLKEQAKNHNIIIRNTYLSKEEVQTLLQECDCYVSLHRSEGFGLTIAEAMACEKPVIVTAYSGNMDFCTPANSYLVPYTLVPLSKHHGPYSPGNFWAQPDIRVAAKLMRRVYEQQQEAKEKAKQAKKTIKEKYTAQALAPLIQQRLNLNVKKEKNN